MTYNEWELFLIRQIIHWTIDQPNAEVAQILKSWLATSITDRLRADYFALHPESLEDQFGHYRLPLSNLSPLEARQSSLGPNLWLTFLVLLWIVVITYLVWQIIALR